MMTNANITRALRQVLGPGRATRDHAYVVDLVRMLLPREEGMARQRLLAELENQRKKDGLRIPFKFEQAVQAAYNSYCQDSLVFQKRRGVPFEALFHTLHPGVWALRPRIRERILMGLTPTKFVPKTLIRKRRPRGERLKSGTRRSR